ncbi:MAG: hypothetical protein PHS31_08540, partial [Victivallaceae bacterium]|nr:hypothetical protein [Victivallaceae bacterium]
MPNDKIAGISGAGIISALGNGISETLNNLYGANPVLPELSRRVETTLLLPVFEVSGVLPKADIPGGFTMQLLQIALDEALDGAKMTLETLKNLRVGVCVGTTVACQLNDIPFYAALRSGQGAPSKP